MEKIAKAKHIPFTYQSVLKISELLKREPAINTHPNSPTLRRAAGPEFAKNLTSNPKKGRAIAHMIDNIMESAEDVKTNI